jgi:simple sugar transport system permease protein
MPELGILALAMMIPLMSGGLNLAIIATANLSALVMAAILTKMLGPDSAPQTVAGVIVLALGMGLLTALLVGLITGMIVAFLGVHPILVTPGTMTTVKRDSSLCHQRRSSALSASDPVFGQWHSARIPGADDHFHPLRHPHCCDHEPCSLRRIGAHDRFQ